MCLISVQAFLAQSLRSSVCFSLKYMYFVQWKLGVSKVHYVSWLNPITLTGDAPTIFTASLKSSSSLLHRHSPSWHWSGFLFISLCSPLKLCVCVCVCVCVYVCVYVWRERKKKREREIGVEALWKVWDYFLQDFNWDIKTPFGCEKWRGKCVLKLGCWLNVLEPEDQCSVLLSPHFS